MKLMELLGIGGKKKQRIQDALDRGAVVIDVRSPHEFDQGHYPGSRNIPLQRIPTQIDKIKNMNRPVILCCASGMRSGSATAILKKSGIDCMNGGSWMKLG